MRTRLLKFVRGAAGVSLLAGGMGVIGGLGVGLASGGTASAAGAPVSGRYACATPIGTEHVQVTISDVNTAPATLPEGTMYVVQPKVVATIPKTLIKTAHTADGTLTSLTAKKATLNITTTGFNGPGYITATNTPQTVPINATTLANGAVVTFTYAPAGYTMTATPGSKATLTPGNITLTVVVPLTCYPPNEKITYAKKAAPTTTETTFSHWTPSGTNANGPIDTVTASTPVHPLIRTWEVASDGGLFAFGNAKFYGSMGGKPLNAPIVGMAATPTGGGYWEVASDGGLFAFGNAQFYGSMGGKPLDAPIVGLATTPTGGGYWEVASDGGLFAFGNAQFYGSMGGKPLNKPIVGMAATPTGTGYWEVASDGGLFAFGTATFHGSMGGKTLNEPIVGMAATMTTGGYWEVASDGGLFAFTAPFFGSMGGKPLNKPIVGMAVTPTGGGYWEVASDGGLFAFGNAKFYGSEGGQPLNKPIVGMAAV